MKRGLELKSLKVYQFLLINSNLLKNFIVTACAYSVALTARPIDSPNPFIQGTLKLILRIAGFPLVANARNQHQVAGLVERVARQVAAAPARNNQFTQTPFNRPADAGLMRQNLQGIRDEIQQFARLWISRLAEKLFQPKQVIQSALAQKYPRHSRQPNGVGAR